MYSGNSNMYIIEKIKKMIQNISIILSTKKRKKYIEEK